MNEQTNTQPDHPDIAPIPQETEYRTISGFWRRLAALFIDSLLLGLMGFAGGLLLFEPLSRLGGWGRLVGFCVALVYFGLFNSVVGKGQTVGKRLMKIVVVDRSGQYIGVGRSMLRFAILGAPFFLNNAMIPPSAMMSWLGYVIGFIVFAFGGAIIYLYIFNRRTRQSLHDLICGTFVTKTSPAGEVMGTTWRFHIVVVGIWLVVCIGLAVVANRIADKEFFSDLLRVQQAIQDSGKVHMGGVYAGKNWTIIDGERAESTFLRASAVWKEKPHDMDEAARAIASIVLQNHPDVMNKDSMTVLISYGFDIGIAHAWRSYNTTHSPAEWQEMLSGPEKE